MAWGINQIEQILDPLKSIVHGYCLSLHSDTSLSLDLQFIEKLIGRVFGYGIGDFKKPIG